MRNIDILFAALAVALVPSCNFLDTRPQDFVSPESFYQNEAQIESAMLGVYAELSTSPLYCNNMQGRMGLDADLGYEHYTTDMAGVGYYDASSSDVKVTNYWKNVYAGINRANMLLAHLDGADAPDGVKSRIRGEALFMRAYYHFMLVSRYGDVPLVIKSTASAAKEDIQQPQTPARDVYRQIIKDLEEAAELLPTASQAVYGSRASKSAAWGILARVCLNMAGYPLYEPGMYAKAKENAEKVINSGEHALNPDYKQVFINLIQDKYDIKECIFEVDFYGNDTGSYTTVAGMVGRNNGVYFNNSTYAETVGISIGCIRATKYYYDLFEEGDLRRDWTIADYTLGTTGTVEPAAENVWERCCGKYRRSYELNKPKSKDKTSTNFPILRYSDVLLMFAEGVACDPDNNSANDVEKAYEYMNQVRRRGYGLDIDTPSAIDVPNEGKHFIMETLKDERARELGYELTRKDDIVRWGEFYTRMKAVGASVPGTSPSYLQSATLYFAGVQNRDTVWPIPSYEIGVNRSLVQNQGW